eukprot:1788896-Amphidinium_carterae.1
MAVGEVKDEVYPNFAEWSAYVDDSALRDFCRNVQGCGASLPEHVSTHVAARGMMYALESLYYKQKGDAKMLEHVNKRKDEDMKEFKQTQEELCLYNETVVVPKNDVPAKCWPHLQSGTVVDKLCVKNSALPRDLKEFPAEGLHVCPEGKASEMGGPLSDLPRGLGRADFSSIPNMVGNLFDLPPTLTFASFSSATDIVGNLGSLPRQMTHADFGAAAGIHGNLADLPHAVTFANFSSAVGVGGDLEDLPDSVTYVNFNSSAFISGDWKDLPEKCSKADAKFGSALNITNGRGASHADSQPLDNFRACLFWLLKVVVGGLIGGVIGFAIAIVVQLIVHCICYLCCSASQS